MGKGGKWAIGFAVGVVVLGGIGALTDDGDTSSGAAVTSSIHASATTSASATVELPTSQALTTTTRTASETVSSSALATSIETTPAETTSRSSSPVLVADSALAAPLPVAPVSQATQADPIVQLLATIPVKGRAPKTGYDRALFGQAWTDDVAVDGGHNGCDTRNDILRRDLTNLGIKPDSNGCTVLTGVLRDLYTGKTIEFTRGQGTSSAVQIDHVVALSDAWQKGAQQLTAGQRQSLANDPLNLQATDGPTNAQKGDGDAATWLPPNKAYRCTYVSRQVQVKARYDLWVTSAEHDAILRVLASCGATVPTTTAVPPPKTTKPAAVTTKPAPPKTSAPATSKPPAAPTTTKPAPPKSTVAPPPVVAPPAPAGCFPTSPAGNCYKAGQFCAKAHHGLTGTDASGRAITCQPDGSRWRWL